MERVFFPFDAELEAELDQIKLAIQGEQNGMATRQMGQMTYKKNYGVSYVVLRELAAQYKPSKKLAGCLWKIGYRETMLLALLLFPVNEIDRQEASALIKEMTEMELVEFASRGLEQCGVCKRNGLFAGCTPSGKNERTAPSCRGTARTCGTRFGRK